MNIGIPSGHEILNEMHMFILVTFKTDIPKNEVHELGDPQHTLSVFCGRYIRITSENTQVHLSKKKATAAGLGKCLHRQISDQIRQAPRWTCSGTISFESKAFCTPPHTNAIDFNTLWNELKFKNTSISYDN